MTPPRPRRRRRLGSLAITLGAATTLSGCSVLHLPPLHQESKPPTATVLINLPPGIREGAHLAFDDLRNGVVRIDLRGATVQAVDLEDSPQGVPDPGYAAQQLRSWLGGSANVLGLIGPRDLRAAEREMPIASNAALLVINPSVIDDCLTQPDPGCPRGEPNSLYPRGASNGQRGTPFFFQVPATASTEGPADADYAYNILSRHSAVVVEDTTTTGTLRGSAFAARFTNDGGTVASTITEAVTPTSAAAMAAKIAAFNPDVVFLAGSDPAQMGQLRKAMGAVTLTCIGGRETIGAAEFLTAAGPSAEGMYAASLEPNAEYSRADLVARLAAAYPSAAPVRGYAVDAYFAAMAMLETIGVATTVASQGQAFSVLPGSQDVLSTFIGAATPPVGIPIDAGDRLGTIEFDATGADLDKVLAVHVVSSGQWTFKEQVSLAG